MLKVHVVIGYAGNPLDGSWESWVVGAWADREDALAWVDNARAHVSELQAKETWDGQSTWIGFIVAHDPAHVQAGPYFQAVDESEELAPEDLEMFTSTHYDIETHPLR